MMVGLMPCPFCGQEVMLGYSSGRRAFLIWHKDNPQKCSFYRFEMADLNIKSLSEARDAWNRRVVNEG